MCGGDKRGQVRDEIFAGTAASKVRPRIDQLASTIDRQLDTARWIGKPAAPGKARQATH